MNESFNRLNVADECKNVTSPLSTYEEMVLIRKQFEDIVLWGDCEIQTLPVFCLLDID